MNIHNTKARKKALAQPEQKLIVSHSLGELPESSKLLLQEIENPFLNFDWFQVFNSHVAPQLGTPMWLSLIKANKTLAILPLLKCREGRLTVLKSMSNYYSSYFDVLTSEENRDELSRDLISHATEQFGKYDIIRLSLLTPSSEERLRTLFSSQGYLTHSYHHTDNWRQKTIVDFDSFWSSRPSRLKSTVKRKGKKLEKLDHQFAIYTDNLTDEVISEYNEIYLRSWKQKEPFSTFIPALLNKMSKAGTLRLGMLYVTGEPVASQIWFVASKTAYIYKLAYDPEFQHLSVGSLLSHHLFKHAIEIDKVDSIDYLTGNDRYKAEWMNSCRPLSGLEIASPKRPLGVISVTNSKIRQHVKNVWKTVKRIPIKFRKNRT